MAALPPPNHVKAFLASVKGRLDDVVQQQQQRQHGVLADGRPSNNHVGATTVAVVLQLELLQRGILWVEPAPTPSAPQQQSSVVVVDEEVRSDAPAASSMAQHLDPILDRVRDAAGRALWEASSPAHTTLLAGASVLQARAAELLAAAAATHAAEAAAAKPDTEPAPHNPDRPVVRPLGPATPPPRAVAPPFRRPAGAPVPGGGPSVVDAASARCREVDDKRFQTLLQLATTTLPGSSPSQSSSTTIETAAACWYAVAEGCYLRAASLLPDNPPLWKGAWDAAQARDRLLRTTPPLEPTTTAIIFPTAAAAAPPWDAVWAMEQLHRIASSKGNIKRRDELSVALIEAALQHVRHTTLPTAVRSTPLDAVSTAALQAFVAPHRSLDPPSPETCLAGCAKHLDILRPLYSDGDQEPGSGHVPTPGWMSWAVSLFDVEYTLAIHRVCIHQDAQDRGVAAARRRSDGTSTTTPIRTSAFTATMGSSPFLEAARINYWRQQPDTEEIELTDRVQRLLDRVLLRGPPPIDQSTCAVEGDGSAAAPIATADNDDKQGSATALSSYYYWRAAECVVSDYLTDWLLERAGARATEPNPNQSTDPKERRRRQHAVWRPSGRAGGRIIATLLERWRDSGAVVGPCGWTHDPGRPALTHRLLCAVPLLEWMHSSSSSESDVDDTASDNGSALFTVDLLTLIRDWQQELLRQRAETEAAVPSESKALGPSSAANRAPWIRLQRALRSTRAWVALRDPRGDGTEGGPLPPPPVVQMEDSTSGDADFGTSFLEFALAWSGWDRLPWSHCTTADARASATHARDALRAAEATWGRPASPVEEWCLHVGRADAEASSSASGGLLAEARRLYTLVLREIVAENTSNTGLRDLLKSKCCYGLANLALHSDHSNSYVSNDRKDSDIPMTAEGLAQQNLELLVSVDVNQFSSPFYLWTSPEALTSAIQFQMAQARQQVADCLLRQGRTSEAQNFLEDAVRHSPDDPGAALALGAFRLRLAFVGQDRSPEISKAAQVQLLKAAKLDSSRSSPFALLGYWYEYSNDHKRALGCYSKALLLDSWHPVAGRGLLRLRPPHEILPLLEKATDSGSPLNGWAWRSLGVQKATVEGNDALAVVSFLQALRSRDILNPRSEPHSLFFSSPFAAEEASTREFVQTSADLAASYRRLGRFTASLRSYYAALDAAGAETPGALLHACAHVEMELGLFTEASEKLAQAMDTTDASVHTVAAYSLSICLLSMAKRDAQDGKAGVAHGYLCRAAESCQQLADQSGSIRKLVGDIHSFGAFLPPDVFGNQALVEGDSGKAQKECVTKNHIAFVAVGLKAYRDAEAAMHGSTAEEAKVLRACAATDAGSNLLLQAQILSLWHGRETSNAALPEATELCRQAEAEFRRAIDLNPLYPAAWCGIGCSVYKSDPLLAQHAFCRSIELDPLQPEPYSNLSFLYTKNGALKPSWSMSDALTQVADTPMMWINRALVMERQGDSKSMLQQAADAYRAALQVAPIPAAKFGLALSGRSGNTKKQEFPILETNCLISEYLDATGRLDLPSRLFGGASDVESGAALFSGSNSRVKVLSGQEAVSLGLKELDLLGYRHPKEALDVEAFAAIQVPADELLIGEVTCKATSGTLKRQLALEPHRGDLWLALAKELVRGGDRDVPGLAAGSLAVQKAIRMLTTSHSTTARIRPDHQQQYIPVQDVADAWSLRYCLDGILSESQPSESRRAPSTTDLQRALFLCPNHSLAREALRQVTT